MKKKKARLAAELDELRRLVRESEAIAELRRKSAEEEHRQLREQLEELVDDRTLQIMMTNERLQNEIAERVLIEEELRARNDVLETFAHTLSHDLRSSVTIIEGYAKVALEGGEDMQRECLEKIVHLTHRMDNFIDSLLAYSEAGRPEGSPVPVRSHELLREILEEREAEMRARNVELVVEGEFSVVEVDPVRLEQVFINLLDNALKYMGDNPAPMIRCGAEEKDGAVIFFIGDNGIGIEKTEQEKIFEPFERLGIEEYYGLGIGLSTVKRAVEGWGGEVRVESTPGKGSTFFFTIPSAVRGTGRA